MRISDWSSDVCSSDLSEVHASCPLCFARSRPKQANLYSEDASVAHPDHSQRSCRRRTKRTSRSRCTTRSCLSQPSPLDVRANCRSSSTERRFGGRAPVPEPQEKGGCVDCSRPAGAGASGMRFCPPGSRWRSAGGPSSGSRSTSSRSRHERANRYAHILSACRRGKNRGPSSCESGARSEEHTSELQSLMRNSYAVFCLQKKIELHYQKELILPHSYVPNTY